METSRSVGLPKVMGIIIICATSMHIRMIPADWVIHSVCLVAGDLFENLYPLL